MSFLILPLKILPSGMQELNIAGSQRQLLPTQFVPSLANVEIRSYSAATSAQQTIALHTVLQRPNPLYICAAT